MHDPSVLAFDVRALKLDIWHDEPGGYDSGEVCGHMPKPIRARVVWATKHARHLRFRWWPYLNVKRWIKDRCDGCGRRFRWKEARHGYQSTNKVWHDPCMSLRSVRSQLDDFIDYAMGEADSNARWRVEYRIRGIEEARSKTKEGKTDG